MKKFFGNVEFLIESIVLAVIGTILVVSEALINGGTNIATLVIGGLFTAAGIAGVVLHILEKKKSK